MDAPTGKAIVPDAALAAAVRRLIQVAALDPELRDGLIAFAKVVLDELSLPVVAAPVPPTLVSAEPPVAADAEALPDSPDSVELAPAAEPEEIVPMSRSALFALIDAALPASAPAAGGAPPQRAHAEIESPPTIEERDWVLPGLRDRLRAKAELTEEMIRARAERREIGETVLHRTRSTGASVWMIELVEPDPEAMADLESSLRATSEAIDLAARLRESAAEREAQARALKTLAAAQSALRVSVQRLSTRADDDQAGVFGWLKTTTHDERVFIDRHMRIDDPLDPAELDAAMEETREALAELEADEERREARSKRLGQLRYHVNRLSDGRGTDHDRNKAIEAASALVEAGLPPSNRELRDLLLPILDQVRDGVDKSRSFALIVREIDRHLDESRRALRHAAPEVGPDPEIERVAELLEGTTMVLIGGEARVENRAALIEAFRLKDIVWLTISDDPTLIEIRTAVARPEVSVVLLLIRWARHRHGEAAEIARDLGKEFVRIPAGMNPRAIAAEIWDQSSEALEQRRWAGRKPVSR